MTWNTATSPNTIIPIEFIRYQFSLLLCLLIHHQTTHSDSRTGRTHPPPTNVVRKNMSGDRLLAVSNHMSFILRHAIAKPKYVHVLRIDKEGWARLRHLRDACRLVRDRGAPRRVVASGGWAFFMIFSGYRENRLFRIRRRVVRRSSGGSSGGCQGPDPPGYHE